MYVLCIMLKYFISFHILGFKSYCSTEIYYSHRSSSIIFNKREVMFQNTMTTETPTDDDVESETSKEMINMLFTCNDIYITI